MEILKRKNLKIYLSLNKSSLLLKIAFLVPILIKLGYEKFKFFPMNLTSLQCKTEQNIYFKAK